MCKINIRFSRIERNKMHNQIVTFWSISFYLTLDYILNQNDSKLRLNSRSDTADFSPRKADKPTHSLQTITEFHSYYGENYRRQMRYLNLAVSRSLALELWNF